MNSKFDGKPAERWEKVFVVFNPGAGMSDPNMILRKIQLELEKRKLVYEIHQTSLEDPISNGVRDAIQNGFDLIIAVGGDGTVSRVASSVVGTATPMAIIPTGTGNIIAKDLQIPLRFSEAINLIFSPDRRETKIDVMKVGEEFYILNVSSGFSAYMVDNIDRKVKRRFGMLAYVWKGVLQLVGLQPIRFRLDLDGEPLHFSASDVLITNSAVIGWYPLMLDPEERMDDGRLSMCIMRARNLFDFIKIGINMVLGRQKSIYELAFLEVKRYVKVDANKSLLVQGDGDLIGTTPFVLEFFPNLVKMIVPKDYDGPRKIFNRPNIKPYKLVRRIKFVRISHNSQ